LQVKRENKLSLCLNKRYAMMVYGREYIQVSQEEFVKLREGVPYGKVYRYNPTHLCPKFNGYGDNGQRKVWSTSGSTHCTYQLTSLSMSVLECDVISPHTSSCECADRTLLYFTYTGCPRRNLSDFARVFLMVKYIDITQNTYVQS
jgi:hypothetical protein